MENFLVIYLLVLGMFSPSVVGFGDNEYYTFRDLDDVAIKIHQTVKDRVLYKDCLDEGGYFKLYKITLSAEEKFIGSTFGVFRTKHYENIEEIPLPKYETEGAKYIYLNERNKPKEEVK